MNTIIISEKSPVLSVYFVLVNALARMRACTISWKNQCSRNFGKFIKQSDPIRICRNTQPKTRPKTTQPKLPTAGNLCLMNVLHPLSSVKAVTDIYRSLAIATTSCNRTHSGFFELKHCYHKQKVWSQIWSDKVFKINQT